MTPSVKVEKLTDFVKTAVEAVNGLTDAGAEDTTSKSSDLKLDEGQLRHEAQRTPRHAERRADETFTTSYDESIETETNKLAIKKITPTNATQTITGSDVAIGSITFATIETSVPADMSKVVTSRQPPPKAMKSPADRGSVTVDAITQAMGTQTLKIEGDSRVEVGSLSLGNGTLNIKGSDVIIHKTDKINGTLTAESGYLGLNVATSMADKVKADTTTTTRTTPNFVLEVGAPVVFGEDAKVTFGGAATSKTTARHRRR